MSIELNFLHWRSLPHAFWATHGVPLPCCFTGALTLSLQLLVSPGVPFAPFLFQSSAFALASRSVLTSSSALPQLRFRSHCWRFKPFGALPNRFLDSLLLLSPRSLLCFQIRYHTGVLPLNPWLLALLRTAFAPNWRLPFRIYAIFSPAFLPTVKYARKSHNIKLIIEQNSRLALRFRQTLHRKLCLSIIEATIL